LYFEVKFLLIKREFEFGCNYDCSELLQGYKNPNAVKMYLVLQAESGTLQCNTPRHNTPTHQAPVMTVNVDGRCRTPSPEPQALLILLEEEASKQDSGHTASLPETQKLSDKPPSPPVFFRCVTVSTK
jgi:hypothetical protein